MEESMSHSLTLRDRNTLTVTGVSEVLSFDETDALLRTGLGELRLQGQDLKLKTLTPEGGTLTVTGTFSGLFYEQSREPRLWHRLLG